MKSYLCERCACLCSPGVAEDLNYRCPNADGQLVEIEADETKIGHLVDKEVGDEHSERLRNVSVRDG